MSHTHDFGGTTCAGVTVIEDTGFFHESFVYRNAIKVKNVVYGGGILKKSIYGAEN